MTEVHPAPVTAARPRQEAPATAADFMQPRFLAVKQRVAETADVVTLTLADSAPGQAPAGFLPGQFNMLYCFGIGEIPVSISSDATRPEHLGHSIRAVGPVSRALTQLEPGDWVGVRGPFGNHWPLATAVGLDVLIMASGIGLVPLRPALYHLLHQRADYGRVALLYGTRTPADLLFRPEIEQWRRTPGLDVRVTMSRAGREWPGDVGYVTAQLPKVRCDPAATLAMLCGPEPMIRASATALQARGVDPARIFVSLERNMKCGLGLCGRCQLGPLFLCRDGPVFAWDQVAHLLPVREL